MSRIIAVSDIHGYAKTFRNLLEEDVKLTRSDHLFLLGDYIDRGPDSKGVIDYILQLKEEGFQVQCLKGNHEELMMASRFDPDEKFVWLNNGGDIALRSFGVWEVEAVEDIYWTFLEGLDLYLEHESFVFVHGGLKFGGSDPFSDKKFIVWGRYWYDTIDYDWLGGREIVHGHTPVSRIELERLFHSDDVPVRNIDNGVYAKWDREMGQMVAADLTNRKLYFREGLD